MPQAVAGAAAGGAVAVLLLVIFVILGVTIGVYLYHCRHGKCISKQKERLVGDQEKDRIITGVTILHTDAHCKEYTCSIISVNDITEHVKVMHNVQSKTVLSSVLILKL